jgi:hypothetical protein
MSIGQPRLGAVSFAQVLAEGLKPGQRLPVFGATCGGLARDDIVDVADRKALDLDVATPGIGEGLAAIRGEDEIEIEGAALELDEVLATRDLRRLWLGQLEAQLAQRLDGQLLIRLRFIEEQVCILGRVRESQQDRRRFADEEIATRYSNAAIAKPRREVLFAPRTVGCRGLERTEGSIVQHGFVGLDERVLHSQGQRSTGGGLEFRAPVVRDLDCRLHDVHCSAAFARRAAAC